MGKLGNVLTFTAIFLAAILEPETSRGREKRVNGLSVGNGEKGEGEGNGARE